MKKKSNMKGGFVMNTLIAMLLLTTIALRALDVVDKRKDNININNKKPNKIFDRLRR